MDNRRDERGKGLVRVCVNRIVGIYIIWGMDIAMECQGKNRLKKKKNFFFCFVNVIFSLAVIKGNGTNNFTYK